MQIKVLSWNIWITGHFDEIRRFLKEADADVIGLQEVQDDDPERDVIKFLTELGYDHVFQPVPKVGPRNVRDGPALFSRLPMSNRQMYTLSDESRRAAVSADIQVGDTTAHVFSTHLLHTHQEYWDVQQEQTRKLLTLLPKEKTILMGDFNATPESPIIEKVRSVLSDSDPLGTPTWSIYKEGCDVCDATKENIRLDYIFTTPELKVENPKVESSTGSDHLPVSAVIEV